MLKKFVIDNNAVAQDKGLEAVLAFLEAASPSISGRLVANISALCTRVSPTVSALAKNQRSEVGGPFDSRYSLIFVIQSTWTFLGNITEWTVVAFLVLYLSSLFS